MDEVTEVFAAINTFIHPYKKMQGVNAVIDCLTCGEEVDLGMYGILVEVSEEFHDETPEEASSLTMELVVADQLYKLVCFLNKKDGPEWVNASLTQIEKKESNLIIAEDCYGENLSQLKKIKEAIENYPVKDKRYNSIHSFAQDLLSLEDGQHPQITLDGLGIVVHEADKRGVEKGGADIWIVFSRNHHLYKLAGCYYSYGGSDYENATLSEVAAKDKIVIIYEELR